MFNLFLDQKHSNCPYELLGPKNLKMHKMDHISVRGKPLGFSFSIFLHETFIIRLDNLKAFVL